MQIQATACSVVVVLAEVEALKVALLSSMVTSANSPFLLPSSSRKMSLALEMASE